jgi:hypothetical protein
MQLTHVDGKDLWLLQRRLGRSGSNSTLQEGGHRGLLIRSDGDEEPMGLAVYDISENRLTVAALRARAFDTGVGRMLIDGLKAVARENRVPSIWLIAEEEAHLSSFLEECGFQPLGFYRADPMDHRSPRMGYWKLE